MDKKHIKLVLVQIREDENVKKEELASFAKYAQIDIEQFEVIDVFQTPNFNTNMGAFDAVFIGGASRASVLEKDKYPFVDNIQIMMLDCLKKDIPVFASCFGFQVAVLALGGEIVTDKENFEMGTVPISLTQKASDDEIYQGIDNNFYAVSVHKQKAQSLPACCELLAFTHSCVHSFKVHNKRFWAFQFHPELDKECLIQRLNVYKDKYTQDKEHFENVINSIEKTPQANKLVSNFIKRVIMAKS